MTDIMTKVIKLLKAHNLTCFESNGYTYTVDRDEILTDKPVKIDSWTFEHALEWLGY